MKLRQKMANFVKRALDIKDPTGWPVDDVPAGERVNERTALALSAVWACVNLLAGTIASLPLMVYRTDARGSRAVAKDHPLYRVLHDSPNYDQTAGDFWEFLIAGMELHGNGFAAVDREGGKVIGLHPVKPDIIKVERNRDGVLEYRWTADGASRVETDQTMLHIRGFGGDPLGGMSTMQFNRNSLGLATAIDKAAGAMFRNGLRPSAVMTMDAVIKTQEQRDEVEAGLQKKFQGAMNAGRPMLLEGGMKFEAITINPDDAQLLESRGFSVEEICRIFGVPPFMVGHTVKVTSFGAGLEQQVLGFQKFTLRRRLKRIEQALEKQLLTPLDRASGVTIEFNLEGLLRGDSAARSSFYQSGLTNGWMTINEVRALENLPPVPGGDTPRMQMQNVPITAAGQQAALPAPAEAEDEDA